jgi:hypothetical protein
MKVIQFNRLTESLNIYLIHKKNKLLTKNKSYGKSRQNILGTKPKQ